MLIAATLAGVPAGAQAPTDSARRVADSLAADSLRARLARAEAAIALLREQLAGEAQSAVRTRSRIQLELSAQVLTNVFLTSGRANNADVPLSVLEPPAAGTAPTDRALGFTLRQTRIGAAAWVSDVLGGSFAGDVDVDFYGGVQEGAGGRRLFPEPRLRTARARIVWPRTELMIGAETPLISDLNPVSLAGVGVPVFSGAGNLWNWLGQVRLSREIATTGSGARRLRWLAHGAVMSPYAGTTTPGEPDAIDAGERSGRPSLEGRLSARWFGRDEEETIVGALIGTSGGEIGIGTHVGWVAIPGGRLVRSRAISLDARAVLARGVELRGEAYAGRLLRGLGGGGIAQNFGAPPAGAPEGTLGPPVRDVAGWAQLNVQPHPVVLSGIGCGVDLVNPDDAAPRRQNTVCAAHLSWRPVQPLVFGLEYRQLGTRFTRGTHGVRHVNLALGFEL